MKKSAAISECKTFRYSLSRTWDSRLSSVLFLGLNPSWADAEIKDNTLRVCINYAQRWGYGGVLLGNLFAYRSPDPSDLYRASDPIGPKNDAAIKALQDQAALTVCAWGTPGKFMGRDKQVLRSLRDPHCLVRLKSGHPGHPLYKKSSLVPIPYER